MSLQFRRGTQTDRLSIIPAPGEPIWQTDNNTFYIGNGQTTGGIQIGGTPGSIANGTWTVAVTSTGTVQFPNWNFPNQIGTNGQILSVDGGNNLIWQTILNPSAINQNLLPAADKTYDLGSAAYAWRNAYLGQLNIVNNVIQSITSSSNIVIGNVNDAGQFDIFRQTVITTQNTTSTQSIFTINGANTQTNFTPLQSTSTLIHAIAYPNQNARFITDTFGTSVYNAWIARSARGTYDTPTALQTNDILLRISGNGYGSTFSQFGTGRIDFVALENFTDTTKGQQINFAVAAVGTTATTNIIGINGTGIKFFVDSSQQYTAYLGAASGNNQQLGTGDTVRFGNVTVTNTLTTNAVKFTDNSVQTVAWTGTVAASQITSVNTSTIVGLSKVGWSNNYNDLNNLPSIPGPFNLSTVTNQALFTTSSVAFTTATITNLQIGSASIVEYADTGTVTKLHLNANGGVVIDATGGYAPYSQLQTQFIQSIQGGATGLTVNDNLTVALLLNATTATFTGRVTANGFTSTNGLAIRGSGVANTSTVYIDYSRGTTASPTAVQSGDVISDIRVGGYDGTYWTLNNNFPTGQIKFAASENFASSGTTTTNAGTTIQLKNQPQATSLTAGSEASVLWTQWVAPSSAPPVMRTFFGQGADGLVNGLTVGGVSYTGHARNEFFYTNPIVYFEGVTSSDTTSSNISLTGTNILNFVSNRKNGIGGQKQALLANDEIWRLNFNAQNANNSGNGSNGQSAARIVTTVLDNATGSAYGGRLTVSTVNSGTAVLSTRLAADDSLMQYGATTHQFTDKTGGFNALTMTTATAVFKAIPVAPAYTAVVARTITGQVGAHISISDASGGPLNNGAFAYWDTSNNRWSYFSNNNAV
jgi:hypothetical protein